MKVGYMRVSRRDQNPDLQRRALEAAGCERIFGEKASGAKAEREELLAALEYVREGDVLVVWKLDRLGRSLKDLIGRMEELRERGVGFASVTEGLDTTTPGGRLVYHVFGALAEWEREVIRERTFAGLQAARARGKNGGRPAKMNERQVDQARAMLEDPKISLGEVCETFGVSKTTLYRHLKGDGAKRGGR
ncbi:MAG: recombinase family protein [Actinomycetota bacterium]|nr:recombinase family protein [Actinomycetota bacterium]